MMLYETKPISEHGIFPSVYVWVKQLWAWKLQPYNSIAQIHVLIFLFIYQNLAHSALSLEYLSNFVVMTMLALVSD